MKTNKLFLILSTLIPLVSAGCSDENIVKYSFHSAIQGREAFDLQDEFFCEDSMFAYLDENEFSYDLAKMGALATESSKNNKLEGKVVTKTDEGNIFTQLGFEDTKFITLNADDYDEDKSDLTAFYISNKKFKYEGEKYQVFSVAVVGSRGAIDFVSNFDIGIDNSNYILDPNSHKEWVNRDNHKGYDVTSERTLKKVDEYLSQYQNKDYKTIMYTCGHSRGGAICNILGKEFTDRKIKTFSYAIAAPTCVSNERNNDYKNLFVIANKNDIVPYLPPQDYGFQTYGKTYEFALEDFEDTWNEMCPLYEYEHPNVDAVKDFLTNVFKNRIYSYTLPDTFEDCESRAFETEQEANEERQKFVDLYKEGTLEHVHSKVGPVSKNDDEEYEFSLTCSPAFIFDLLNSILLQKGNLIENILNALPFMKRYIPDFLDLAINFIEIDLMPKILMSHLCSGYLVLIKAMEDNNLA